MKNGKRILLTAIITIIGLALVSTSFAGSSKKRGKTYSNNIIEISSVESKELKDDSVGNTWYSFKAKVRNRTRNIITVTICFQAVDRNDYEIASICFVEKQIKGNGSKTLTEKTVTEIADYKAIWKWQIDSLNVE